MMQFADHHLAEKTRIARAETTFCSVCNDGNTFLHIECYLRGYLKLKAMKEQDESR